MNFRYDINGLRAFAVIAVVIFHFNPTFLSGGFAGVDVFFVISGYLMTAIIFRGLDVNSFSLYGFYRNRFIRIVPPLAFMIFTLIVIGWFLLNPIELRLLNKHALSSLTFFSNVIYWRESGYFDVESHTKWLLHTWSLSVEWQFYLVYPIVLCVLKKIFSLNSLKKIILASSVLMFLFGLIASYTWVNASYYLLPMRSWEMLLGGVAYLYPFNSNRKKSKALELIGVISLVSSFIFIDGNTPWPGYAALVPTVGTFAIIIANLQNSKITNNYLFQTLGKWSYSIYLWHWPVVVFGSIYNIENWNLTGILLSVIFGGLSYHYIERIKYKSEINPISAKKHFGFVLWGGVVALTGLLYINPHWNLVFWNKNAENFSFYYDALNFEKEDTKDYTWRGIRNIESSVGTEKTILVIGDSQAGDFLNVLFELDIEENSISSSIVPSKCGVGYLEEKDIKLWRNSFANETLEKKCLNYWGKVKENLEGNAEIKTIIYAMLWRDNTYKLIEKSIRSMKELNPEVKVVIIGNKYIGNLLNEQVGSDIHKVAFDNVNKHIPIDVQTSQLSNSVSADHYIDLYKFICDKSNKKCQIETNGKSIFYDDCHTTKDGVMFIAKNVRDEILSLL